MGLSRSAAEVGNSDLGELSKTNDFEEGGMRPGGSLTSPNHICFCFAPI